ncbi:hypothetical protein Tco_1520175, partial [Tanacetum coccineum]
DSEDSTVTYTAVSSPFGGLLDIEYSGFDGPPVMPEDPYAYMFVLEPVYPEFMPPEDEVFPAEEQPLPAAVSPTADLPGYITDSGLEDPEEVPEEDPTDYPADGGDDDDGDDESSNDDEDDYDDVEEDKDEEEEEEEHPTLADSVPPPVYRVTARMSIRDKPPTPFWFETKIARLLTIPSPLPSPLSLWSSPLPQIPSPPLPVSPPLHVSPPPLTASPTYPLGFRAAMIRQRAKLPSTSYSLPLPPPIILSHTMASMAMIKAAAPSTYIFASQSETPPSGTPPLLPIPLPTPSPPLLLSSTNLRADMPEVCLPPRKRFCIVLGLRYEVGKSSSTPIARPTRGFRADYGFVTTLDDEIRQLGRRMTKFVTTVRQDTDEIYRRLDEAQDDRSLMSGRLNMLFKDRCAHACTTLLMERDARLSREAWGRSMDASDTAHYEVRALRTTVLA